MENYLGNNPLKGASREKTPHHWKNIFFFWARYLAPNHPFSLFLRTRYFLCYRLSRHWIAPVTHQDQGYCGL